jgi:hypothetical protein
LRVAFESCANFDDACRFLEAAPVARPVLFLVAGCAPGERVLIEREIGATRIYRDGTVVANAWRDGSDRWRPRACGDGKPVENNRRRVAAMSAWTGRHPPHSGWATPPIVNGCTRVSVEMCAATGQLRVCGWEAHGGGATPVTAVTEFETPSTAGACS